MRNVCLIATLAIVPAWGQSPTVKPTPGALAPVGSPPVMTAEGGARPGVPTRHSGNFAAMQKLEGDFDLSLKTADPANPFQVFGLAQGVYLAGFGAVFTAKLDLAVSNVLPMFPKAQKTSADVAELHSRKLRHLDLLRAQMRSMITNSAKTLDLGPNDQIVVAVRLLYQGWEDRSGLPDQIVMKADRRGAETGDVKVDVQ